jgi:hypothetical protein
VSIASSVTCNDFYILFIPNLFSTFIITYFKLKLPEYINYNLRLQSVTVLNIHFFFNHIILELSLSITTRHRFISSWI